MKPELTQVLPPWMLALPHISRTCGKCGSTMRTTGFVEICLACTARATIETSARARSELWYLIDYVHDNTDDAPL